ncbi:MAG: YbjN domain-containing protein [Devosia sp.]
MKLLAALLGATMIFAAAPALADDHAAAGAAAGKPPAADNVTAKDPQTILKALSNLGYPGKLEKLDSGRTSIAVQVSGLKTFIDFYDCADDLTDCYTLLFNVSLDLKSGTTPGKVNEWNSKQITGRVWTDDNSDPTLDFSFSTFDGVTASVFNQNVKLWDKKIGDLKDFFDF